MKLIEEKKLKKPKIIGCTAYVSKELHDKCLKAGMERVLTKPIQIKDLKTIMNNPLIDT